MNEETKQAIKELGGRKGVAWIFNVTYSAVNTWEKKGIPPRYVPIFSELTFVPREELRPDIYGDCIKIPPDIMSRYITGMYKGCAKKSDIGTYCKPIVNRFEERDSNICQLFKSGKTLQEIGDQYEFTREYIRQILAKYGITGEDGGKHIQVFASLASKEKAKQEKRDKSCAARWGCTKEQYDRLRAMSEDYSKTPIQAYVEQKRNAKNRDIDWKLTLWEWWCIWRDSGKYELRGRKLGNYVMGRIEDIGGYERENVEIITASQNIKDYYAIYGSEHQEKRWGKKPK